MAAAAGSGHALLPGDDCSLRCVCQLQNIAAKACAVWCADCSMRMSVFAAVACILAAFASVHAQQAPPYMQLVRLDDLSQARKDLASAYVNMSFYKRGELREDVMFAGGDYAASGCTVSEVTDLYISYGKTQPMRVVLPVPNISVARANLAGSVPLCCTHFASQPPAHPARRHRAFVACRPFYLSSAAWLLRIRWWPRVQKWLQGL